MPFLKVSSLVKLYPLPKPWTVNPYLRSATSWMMSSLFWESVDRSWGVSFLLWWNRVVSSLSLLGSFIGRFGLHGCSIPLWTFPSTSSYALKQSRSNPSLLHLIRGPLYILPFFRLQFPAVVPVRSFMGLLLTHGSTVLTLGPCLFGLGQLCFQIFGVNGVYKRMIQGLFDNVVYIFWEYMWMKKCVKICLESVWIPLIPWKVAMRFQSFFFLHVNSKITWFYCVENKKYY